jgi:hypothetical protein
MVQHDDTPAAAANAINNCHDDDQSLLRTRSD